MQRLIHGCRLFVFMYYAYMSCNHCILKACKPVPSNANSKHHPCVEIAHSSYLLVFPIKMQMAYSRNGQWTVETSTEMMVKQTQPLLGRANEAMTECQQNMKSLTELWCGISLQPEKSVSGLKQVGCNPLMWWSIFRLYWHRNSVWIMQNTATAKDISFNCLLFVLYCDETIASALSE